MNAAALSPIAARFVWKEYRALRGMWIGVFAIAVGAQWLTAALAAPGFRVSQTLLIYALGAGILHAIGATALIFSAEHEEESYSFLTGLPTRWWPMFVGKWSVAALSSLLLAAALACTGAMIDAHSWTSPRWPNPADSQLVLTILGIAIVEALAWGTLFSLLIKRPLVAAILAVFVGGITVQLIVSAYANGNVTTATSEAFLRAIPVRLAIVVAVGVLCLARARNWLEGSRPPRDFTKIPSAQSATSFVTRGARVVRTSFSMPRRRSTFSRLLWHAWRQSWRTLLMPLFVAVLLTLAIAAATAFTASPAWTLASACFLPAIYGAMVFSADQHRQRYRFFAEHAAPPRWVWLSRVTVWGLAAFLMLAIMLIVLVAISSAAFYENIRQFIHTENWRFGSTHRIAQRLLLPVNYFGQGSLVVVNALVLAFAAGQVFSMLLRSEIIAAAVSCLASVVVVAWAALMVIWQLNPLWTMLPLTLACFAATWWRAPSWITERRSVRSWLGPAACLVVPIAAIAVAIPIARLAPVDSFQRAWSLKTITPVEKRYIAGNTPAARETADMYFHAADTLEGWQSENPLARWNLQEPVPLTQNSEIDVSMGGEIEGVTVRTTLPPVVSVGEVQPIDTSQIISEYRAAVAEYWKLRAKARDEAIKEFFAASQRPTCRFDFDLTAAPINMSFANPEDMNRERARLDPRYRRLYQLQSAFNTFADKTLDPWQSHLAALRATAHFRSGQPTLIACEQLSNEQYALERIVAWSRQPTATSDQIRAAIAELQELFHAAPDPAESVVADRNLVADVLDGKSSPLLFAHPPLQGAVQLAFVLHQLPWERERAMAILDIRAADDITRLAGLVRFLREGPKPPGPRMAGDWPFSYSELRDWLQSRNHPLRGELRFDGIAALYASFVDYEYSARSQAFDLTFALVWTEMRRRATLIQLALELYRRDHDTYPRTLAELAPDYLEKVPLDPFAGTPFNYLPDGADLPIMDARSDNQDIAPDTPLFWSVGPHNVGQLVRTHEWQEQTNLADPMSEPEFNERPAKYRFSTDTWGYHSGYSFGVFPLPPQLPKPPTDEEPAPPEEP